MKRTLFLSVFLSAILFANSGYAACADVLGSWKLAANILYNIENSSSNPSTYSSKFGTFNKTFIVNKQKGCFFSGVTDDGAGFSGYIDGTEVSIVSRYSDTIVTLAQQNEGIEIEFRIDAQLSDYDTNLGKYKTLICAGGGRGQTDSAGFVSSYKGKATRQ